MGTITTGQATADLLDTLTGRTRDSYRAALARLFAPEQPVAELDDAGAAARLRARFTDLWGDAAASTWNARLSALRKAVAHWRDRGWLSTDPAAGLSLRKAPKGVDRSRGRELIDALIRRDDLPLRDRALWSLLYATAARSAEVLALNVEDLDLRNRRAKVTRKGGAADIIAWDTRTAKMLGRLLAGRRQGPVFLTDRQAKGAAIGAVESRDLDLDSGRGRLSYRRALELFTEASGGWTLHDLRHSALTHAAEQGMSAPMLMTMSGHQDIRTLARYARPSIDAVARWKADHGG